MIGHRRLADLLKDRRETLEQMKDLAWQMGKLPEDSPLRAEYETTIREFGKIAIEIKDLYEKESKEGVPEKWIKYYEVIERLENGNQLSHPEADRESGATRSGVNWEQLPHSA